MPRIRINDRIRVSEVRVVDADGEQVGIMKTEQALQMAKRHSLDLVEISPNARPPVCRICDFGKYQYEESKKKKDSKKNSHAGKVKEVQLRPRCEQHDFDFKLKHAIQFLQEGVNAIVATDDTKAKFGVLARELFKKYKAS